MRFATLVLTLGLTGCQQCQKGQGIVAANPAPDAAFSRCREGLSRAQQAGTIEGVATSCSALFSNVDCGNSVRALGDHPRRSNYLSTFETCRLAYCPLMPKPSPSLCSPERGMVRRIQAGALRELFESVLTYELGRRATVLQMLTDEMTPENAERLVFDAPITVLMGGTDAGAVWVHVVSDEGRVSVDSMDELSAATRKWDPDGGVAVLAVEKQIVFRDVQKAMRALNEGGANDIELMTR